METNINILIGDNIICFEYILPNELYLYDEKYYMENIFQPFYYQKSTKINMDKLITALNKKKSKIAKHLKLDDKYINNDNITFNLSAFNINDIINFIKVNNDIKIKLSIDNNHYSDLINNLSMEDSKNLYVIFDNCDEYIKFKEFSDMYIELKKIVDFIKKYDLSEIEKVMLAYDIIKANKYKKEGINDDYNESRNLNKIIKGDKIVCLGYANLLNFILNELQINNQIILTKKTNNCSGHARNLIKINDKKYGINGQFFADCTWDSQKSDDYLNNYLFFLKPLKYFKNIKNEIIFRPSWLELLKLDNEELIEEINILSNNDKRKIIYSMSDMTNNNFIKLFLNIYKSSDLTNELLKIVEEMKKNINQSIPRKAFKNALYKVRRIEYINNIIDNEITEDYIDNICNKYYSKDKNLYLIKMIFDENIELNPSLKDIKAKNVRQDSLRLKLLKELKKYINDIPQENFINKMKTKKVLDD